MGSSPRRDYSLVATEHRKRRKRKRPLFERRLRLFTFLCALPGIGVSGILIWMQAWTLESKISLFILEVLLWLVLAVALHDQVIRPLQTLTNVVSALREEDYSFRARGASTEDALGELALEVNALADLLAEQRTRAIEATALLRRVVEEIDVPIFAFDPESALKLVNSAGERLLQQPATNLFGQSAVDIGLQACLEVESGSTIPLSFHSPNARWLVRRSSFRQDGVPHTLIVLSDVSRVLREEERSAWQRLIRVLGHELNNSLAPIKSIAGSLSTRLSGLALDDAQHEDFKKGFSIIEARAASLNRFLQAYRELARFPKPVLRRVALGPVVERVAGLELRVRVRVAPGPEITLMIDPDQIEQMLINLVRNAVEATLEPHPANAKEPAESQPEPEVTIRWEMNGMEATVLVEDNGPGLLNPDNAFVPFYTTKAEGSGIGLVLSRQIAEAHGGSIQLMNRREARGCTAKVVLPRVF